MTPSRERLIHLLIEERAARLAMSRVGSGLAVASEADRAQARREIEREVLAAQEAKK